MTEANWKAARAGSKYTDAIARSVMKVVNGQELTNEERNALVASKRGVELMNTISSVSQRDSAEIKAYNEAYNAGYYGRESTKAMNQTYYQQGVKDAQAAEQKRLDRVGKGKAGTGSVSYIGTVLDKSGLTTKNATSLDANTLSRLESQQQDAVSAIQEIAKAVTTINFALYEGQADDTGNITVPNGMYDATSNTLYIDLNSGKNRSGQGVVEYTIMQTVGHELTHYIETNSAKGYAVYKDLVRQTLEARGQDFDALVNQKVRNAEANGISLTRDGAVYEVVANASEMMLKDTKALQQLAQQNTSLAEKVKTFVKDLLAKIRKALGKVGAQHPEAKALMEAEQYVAGLQEAWDAALVEAVETVKGSETGETWNGIPVVNKFELREPVEKKGNLVATHAVSDQNLMRMLDEGTMVGMSLAVAQADSYSSSKFGDNTLVFYASAIDPEANPDNHIFGFDAWTPRRSTTVYQKNESAIQQARETSVKTLQDSGVDAEIVKSLENFFATHLEQQPADWIKTKNGNAQKVFNSPVSISGQNSGINALYLLQNGITAEQINAAYSENTRALIDMFQSSPQLMESLNQFKSEIASGFYEGRLFEQGITDVNERSDSTLSDITVENTPDNALAIMKQKPLTDQGDSVGADGIRRKVPLVYNTLNEVRNDQGRLSINTNTTEEQLNAADSALAKFKSEVRIGNQSTAKIEGILQNAAANNQSISDTVRALWKAGYIKANKKNVGKVMEAIQSFRNSPTNYFEAKLMRKSSFSEVAAAVVRESSADLISRLKENGIRVLTYDGTLNDRIAKVNSVNEAKFSLREVNDKQVVWVNENILDKKPTGQSVNAYISNYIANHIDDMYTLIESGSKVYMDKNIPGEYVHSKYTSKLYENRRDLYNAKMRMVPGIGEMIEIASNRRWEQTKHSQNKDAKYGVYKYTSHVAFMNKNKLEAYQADLVILNASNGKKYLYDIQGIKKDVQLALILRNKDGWGNNNEPPRTNVANSISESSEFDNPSGEKFSLRAETESDLTRQYLESMEITDSMNESEKWLLGKYQRTQQEIAEKEAQIAEQDELKAKATTNDERTKAENRAKILRDQVKRLRNAMRTMERSDGFGGLMRRSEDVVKRFMQYSDMTQATDLSDQLNADLNSLNSQLESAVKAIQSTEGAQRAMLAKGMLNEQSLIQAGKNVRATFGTRMSGKDISNRLALAYAELYATEGEQGVSSFTRVMRDLAEDVLRRSNRRYQSATLDDLRENLQGSISLTDAQKQELKNAGISQSEFKRVMSGVVNVSDSGTSLASIVSNAEYYGSGIISQIASTDSEGDMILKLYNLVSEEKAKERSFALDGMSETDSINYTMAEIMSNANIQLAVDQNTMDAIQTAMQQGSETNQKVVSKINAAMKGVRSAKITGEQLWRSAANADQTARQALEYYRAIDEQRRILEEKEIVQQLKSDAVSKLREERTIREYAQKATSRMQHIRKTVKGLNDMLLHETDYKNVPEELKAYVGDVVTTFGEKFGSMVFSGKQAKELLATYEKLRNSDSSFMQAQYDEDLASTLHALNEWAEKYQQLKESGKNRLEKAQLRILITEAVDDLVSNVKTMVRNSTETRINGRKKMFADIADSAINEMMERPDHTNYQNKLGDAAAWLERAIVTGNTTPVYFFDQMGNTQFKNLFKDFQNGQEKWAFVSAASKQRIQEFRQAYNYDAWSDADALTFTTQQGHEITLDKEQALWLYATWKREHANPIAATEHLTKGGFVYEGNKGTASGKGLFGQKAAEITTGNRITEADMKAVYGYLTEQEKGYADAMVNYLSTEIGALGNEISMELFGIRKYKEGYYFPYATARDQRFQKSASGGNATTDDSRIKHASFTHALTRGAATTLVMGNFTDVVANHIGQMALYSSMTLPIENMNRVLNYRFATEDGGTTTMRSLIRQKYGSNTLNYMERFLLDMNGGIRGTDKSAFQKTISLFKKSAVVASLSVSLQQTSAMLRAGAMMNYKYLLQTPANYKAEYDQLMQHSGVAIVKQMGRFDTNVGQSYNEWLLSPEDSNLKLWSKARQALFLDGKDAAKSRWEALVTGLPNTMDAVAWSMMWKAVKSEQADLHPDMDVNSNEFLDMCGKRFNDIAYHTQVFDSTLTRSQLMRSTNPIDQMATAFRAEPTLTLNVLYDAFFNKNIPKGERASRRVSALSAVMLSSIAAAFGSAMISAWGNDDDDRTAAEKIVRTTNDNFWSNLLPWYNIPYISDIVSLMQGYDVERADMSLFQDVVNGFNKVQQWREGNTTWYRAMEEFVGSLANFLGIPAKNLMRDARRIYNMTNTRWEKPTQTGMEAALVPDSVLPFLEYDTSTTAYYERLVSAYAKGNTAKARDIETYIQTVGGKDADQIRSGVKSAVADRFEAGTMTEEEATNLLYKLYGNEKGFDKDSLYYYFDKLKDKMSGKLQEGETYSKFNDFYTAVETGKNLKAEISELTSHGTTRQSIASAITSHFKETYISLYNTSKTEASQLQARLLTAYEALGYKREDKIKDIQKWVENDEKKTSK